MFSLKNRQPFTIAAFDNFGLANNYRYYGILTLIFILAIISQYAVFNQGFYSVSFDESARALMSDELNLRNAIEPFVWPPVYKIFTGLVLKLYDDLFFIPRIIAFISGLLVLVELIILSDIFFGDRIINIATAVLGLYLRHRFIFSIAPMSEIYFNLFILAGSIFLICWLKKYQNWQIIMTSFCWFLASATRYEGCYFSLVLLLYLIYCFFQHQISFKLLAINAFWLCLFPAFWIVNSWLFYGNLENLSITKQQALWAGLDYFTTLKNNHLLRLIREMLLSPLIFGGVSLVYWVINNKSIRAWTMIMSLALLGISLSTFISKTSTSAAPWRISGVWVLMCLPFLAFSLKTFAQRVIPNIAKPFLLATLLISILFYASQSLVIAADNKAFTPEELNAGMYIRTLDLQQTKPKILIETESYSYLNILTASNIPEQFILSTGDDPQRIALYVGRKDYIKQNKPQLYQDYIVSKYDFTGALNPEKLARENIGYIMLENKSYQTAADNNPNLKPLKNFGNWKIYEFD